MPNDSSKPSIPEWQRKPTTPPADPITEEAKDTDNSDNHRSALLEQAKTFLSDPEIRDATTNRKITFLESKGLTNDEIGSLLGVSRNEDVPAAPEADDTNSDSETTTNTEEIKTSTASATATSTVSPSSSPSPASTTPRDVPPIITYPEFLVNTPTQHKPPLLSLRSVLYTLYGAAGVGATLYGTSEFLVKPMLATLSSARQDLAETTLANLSTMNEKLEKTVSKIPTLSSSQSKPEKEEEEDTESITSDPTEVFHRDIATQTSPDLLNAPTSTSSSPEADTETINPHKVIDTHTAALTSITSQLRAFSSSTQTISRETDQAMRDRISELQSYLDGLTYSSSSYNTYSYLNSSSLYNSSSSRGSGASKEEDAISSFRAEIRGVKGALLSARNFPSGRPAAAGVAR